MKGRQQGACAGCGTGKFTHDRNAGWWELGRRRKGGTHLELLFCPRCSPALLVGLDERMGRGANPNLVAVLSGDLLRALYVLEAAPRGSTSPLWQRERESAVEHFAELLKRKPWTTVAPFEET